MGGALLLVGLGLAVGSVGAQLPYLWLNEYISVQVACDTARIYISCTLVSGNLSLVSFPEEFNLADSNLADAISVGVTFSEEEVELTFIYKGISSPEARNRADSMMSQANSAFNLAFSHFLTTSVGDTVQVIYKAGGPSNMESYVNSLVAKCLAEGTEGFSHAIPGVFQYENAKLALMVSRVQPSKPWSTATLTANSIIEIPHGSGSHQIDILNLFGIQSLAPSPYAKAKPANYYYSTVYVTLNSSNPLSVESYQPSFLATSPFLQRGWIWTEGTNHIDGVFYFGSNGSQVDELSVTFNGTIVPEINHVALLTLMLIVALTLGFSKAYFKRYN